MAGYTGKKKLIISFILFDIVIVGAVLYLILFSRTSSAPEAQVVPDQSVETTQQTQAEPAEAYEGVEETVANAFTVKVPNGWKASIADTGSFQAIMFARPEQLNSLVYDANAQPIVDRNGIPAWNGLTEHFFIRFVQPSQAFNPANHQEVSSESFTFDDGTVGTKFYVLKHAAEAQAYGGLLRDSEWQGRTYIYEKNGMRIEAHLALYPSSSIDKDLYETIVRSIKSS